MISSGAVAGVPYVAAAVADGHGSSDHDRSEIGAHLAVQAATQCFAEFAVDRTGSSLPEVSRLFQNSFGRTVAERWRSMVLENGTFREKERRDRLEEDRLVSRYGSTLLVAGIFRELVLLACLGDGDVVVFYENGHEPENVFAGGEAGSLYLSDSWKLVQTRSRQLRGVRAVTLSTDGLRRPQDSGSGLIDRLSTAVRSLNQYGPGATPGSAFDCLDWLSEEASDDDVTLMGLVFQDPSFLGKDTLCRGWRSVRGVNRRRPLGGIWR